MRARSPAGGTVADVSGRSRAARIGPWTPPPCGELLDDVAAGARQPRRGGHRACAGCPSPTSASPGSTTTARCARAWPRRSTGRARRRRSAPPSSTELLARSATRRRRRPPGAAHPGRRGPGRGGLAANPDGPPSSATTVIVAGRGARATGAAVVVATAGTADLPVADECAAVLGPRRGADPPHRRRRGRPAPAARRGRRARRADAVVVVAGMEGALASVVGGLTGAPVVAVPTRVGYGSSSRASPPCSPCWRRAPPA